MREHGEGEREGGARLIGLGLYPVAVAWRGPYTGWLLPPSTPATSLSSPSSPPCSSSSSAPTTMASHADHQGYGPFIDHLIASLSVYELGPISAPIPRYEGPTDWKTNSIQRSLAAMARRMITAEEAYNAIKAAESCGPESKKRRSVGDSPPSSSASSTSSTDLTTAPSASALSNVSPFFTPSSSYDSIPSAFSSAGRPHSNESSPRHENGEKGDDVDMADTTTDDGESEPTPSVHNRATSKNDPLAPPMTISLDGVPNPMDKGIMYGRAGNGPVSAPTTQHDQVCCPSCGRPVTDSATMAKITSFTGEPISSPLVVPPGPLAAAAFESGMSAVEELRLLKAQVQDVALVCNAVARGDLSKKITVPVQGVVMVQLKEVINAMVCFLRTFYDILI